MNLTARLSTFALISVLLMLLGFSVTLFVLTDRHLTRQIDLRIDAAMHTLVAAIEVHPGDVEWEPLERRITMGHDPGDEQIHWLLHDRAGRLIDCSRNLTLGDARQFDQNGDWRILVHRVRAGDFHPQQISEGTGPTTGRLGDWLTGDDSADFASLPDDRTCRSTAFTLTAAIPWTPVATSLRQLAWTLFAISGLILVVAAVLGRWICRRALRPVTCMAQSARLLPTGDAEQRLEVSASNDELEDLGVAFNELLARLHAAYEQQRRFAGDAAHQLRTPLTALLGQIEVALRQHRSEEEYRRVLSVLQRRSSELRNIVEALLFLARTDSNLPLPNLEAIDLNSWLRDYVAEWSHPAHPRELQFSNDVECKCSVRVRDGLLAQLLDSLLDNACKYSDPSTPIQVRFQTSEGACVISVIDLGCGIDHDDLPHVCEPFFRTETARLRNAAGMGLGLAMAERIVRALGGKLEIISEPGEGTRVNVLIPAENMGVQMPHRERIGSPIS